MVTKHEKILNYIEHIPIGDRLSVRKIAKQLEVSEGTAYKAIKEAADQGLVTTIGKVGTIRIESKQRNYQEGLSFKDVLGIVDGVVVGGEEGLDKPLHRFIIGAMEEEAMSRYFSDESLIIIGNREDAQKMALENGLAVLITGGFMTSQDVIDLSDRMKLPILSTTYDTFTVASLINRALSDQSIKKEVLIIDSVYTRKDVTDYLYADQTISDFKELSDKSGHTRFPVVHRDRDRVLGMVVPRDIIGHDSSTPVRKVMTKNVHFAQANMSVSHVAHSMIWDGLEIMPVVDDHLSLIGIISRRDVMKAMQNQQKQDRYKDTVADQVKQLLQSNSERKEFTFDVTPQMTNNLGNISFGVLNEVISEVAGEILEKKRKNFLIEQVQLHYFKVIPISSSVMIKPSIFDDSRRAVRIDFEIYSNNVLVAKALMTCQYM